MEMEEERISMVLVRASELHSKIANCIHKTTTPSQANPLGYQIEGHNISNGVDDLSSSSSSSMESSQVEDEEAEALFNICEAFDSLESQLTSLQGLLQQQQYQTETVIVDIEHSRQMLLKNLGEYKGAHLDVIREAEAFASMKVEHEHDNELLLPPYPTHTPHSLVSENSQLSHISHTRKLAENGCNGGDLRKEQKTSQPQSRSGKLWGGLRFLAQSTAKTMLTLVGVISLLSLAGFEPRLRKKGAHLKVLTHHFEQPDKEDRRLNEQCPPGKVAVMEDGEIHCVVKERVEIPFDSFGENPGLNYGCG